MLERTHHVSPLCDMDTCIYVSQSDCQKDNKVLTVAFHCAIEHAKNAYVDKSEFITFIFSQVSIEGPATRINFHNNVPDHRFVLSSESSYRSP